MIKERILRETIWFIAACLVILAFFLMAAPGLAEESGEANDEAFALPDGLTQVDFLPSSVWIDGTELYYDQLSGFFFWSIAKEPDHTFQVRADGFINPNIVFPENIQTDEDIRRNQAKAFIIYDQDIFFQGKIVMTTLPIISLACDNEISDEYIPMSMRVWDNQQQELKLSNGEIKLRGATTRFFPKKSFRISLKKDNGKKNHVSFLGMRTDDDWILYPAYNDQEKIRNVFCTNLWKETCGYQNSKGVSNGNEYRFVELFINDSYWGLYALGTPLDNKEMFSTEYDNEVIFKKEHWSDEYEELEDPGVEKLTGYEIYKTKGIYETDEGLCWELLKKYYVFLVENHSDSAKLIQRIDVNNFTHLDVFLNMVQGVDNIELKYHIKNEYLCISDCGDTFYSTMAPWDLDLTFGNNFSEDPAKNYVIPYAVNPTQNITFLYGYYGQILLNMDMGLEVKMDECYQALRRDAWSDEKINAMLDEYEDQIYGSGAYLRDMERWPEGTYSDPNQGLSIFRHYVLARLKACDKYYGVK